MHSTALLFVVLMLVQGSSAARNALEGSRAANFEKSRLHPSFQFQRATLHIRLGPGTATLSSELVSQSGQTVRGAETFRTDGTETAGTLSPGVTLFASWVGPDVLATVARKGGQTIGLITYEISADGRTLTSRSSGLLEQVVVFDRQ